MREKQGAEVLREEVQRRRTLRTRHLLVEIDSPKMARRLCFSVSSRPSSEASKQTFES